MVIVKTTNVPDRVRGKLACYFLEIDSGLYIGSYNARTRGRIWSAIINNATSWEPEAVIVMAWATQDDNGFSFISFGERRRCPVNVEGLILSKFSPIPEKETEEIETGH